MQCHNMDTGLFHLIALDDSLKKTYDCIIRSYWYTFEVALVFGHLVLIDILKYTGNISQP